MVFLILFYGEKIFDIDSGRLTGEWEWGGERRNLERILTIIPFLSDSESAKSRAGNVHFTMIFNVFVLMTLFNEINARLASTTFSIRQFIVEIAKSAI